MGVLRRKSKWHWSRATGRRMGTREKYSRAEAINLKVHFKSYHMDLRSLRGVSSICNFSQYCRSSGNGSNRKNVKWRKTFLCSGRFSRTPINCDLNDTHTHTARCVMAASSSTMAECIAFFVDGMWVWARTSRDAQQNEILWLVVPVRNGLACKLF